MDALRLAVLFLFSVVILSCGPGDPGKPDLKRLFPWAWHFGAPTFEGCVLASPLHVKSQGEDLVLVTPSDGKITAVHPKTGEVVFEAQLDAPAGKIPSPIATPVVVEKRVIVAYQITDEVARRESHHVVALDLEARALDPDFPKLSLEIELPTSDGTGTVPFLPSNALSRSALVHGANPENPEGFVYISFGNAADIQPWHGWVFEVDLRRWKAQGADEAISAVFLATPENDCGLEGASGASDTKCGAGIWSPAGPRIQTTGDGDFELIVPTGNGQLDLQRRDYANGILRMGPGLDFDPACDPDACADFDPLDPAHACLESCANLFLPRLLEKSDPLRVATGGCDDKTFMECYAALDYDLGANSPAFLEMESGHRVWVLPAKDGAVYLFDADHFGHLHDRVVVMDQCGTKDDPCKDTWAGMMVTEPIIASVGERAVVLVNTFIRDESQPAGVVALELGLKDGEPALSVLWKSPDFDGPEAVERFRRHPSRMVLSTAPDEEAFVWLVEVADPGKIGTVMGFRIADGEVVDRRTITGRGQRFIKPLLFDNTLYFSSCVGDTGPSHLEGWAIQYN
jgi:hypothetical protein